MERLQAEGVSRYESIVSTAQSQATQIKAEAQAQAKQIKGQADAEAAAYYVSFAEHPELANFLRKLETLRKSLTDRATIVLDSTAAPFDLLQSPPGSTSTSN